MPDCFLCRRCFGNIFAQHFHVRYCSKEIAPDKKPLLFKEEGRLSFTEEGSEYPHERPCNGADKHRGADPENHRERSVFNRERNGCHVKKCFVEGGHSPEDREGDESRDNPEGASDEVYEQHAFSFLVFTACIAKHGVLRSLWMCKSLPSLYQKHPRRRRIDKSRRNMVLMMGDARPLSHNTYRSFPMDRPIRPIPHDTYRSLPMDRPIR